MFVGTFVNVRLIDHYSASNEPVAAGYTAPTTLAAKLLTVTDANVSSASLYGRALSDTEVVVLANRNLGKTEEAKKLTDAASEPVKLDSGLLASGKDLSSLADKKIEGAMTFSAIVSLPAGEEPLSGTLFAVGEGQNAMVLGVEKDKLYWKADGSTISQGIPLPRGKDEKGNIQRTHVTAAFDGKVIRLYANGAIHKTVNWNMIWVILTAMCAVLAAAFWFVFRDDVLKKSTTAPQAAGQAEATQA